MKRETAGSFDQGGNRPGNGQPQFFMRPGVQMDSFVRVASDQRAGIQEPDPG